MGGRRGNRRRVTFWLGVGLLAAGLGLLGYVGWQLVGSNIVSERRQREIVRTLEQRWREAPPSVVEGVDRPQVVPVRVGLGEAFGLVRVPRFGADFVRPMVEGVGSVALAQGFAHFPKSAPPGGRGNFALAAHRVTRGEPLRDMPSLRPGDKIVVETRGAVFTYELDTSPFEVTFRDVWVVDERPRNPDREGPNPAGHPRLITLTTCAELFHTDNRLVAFGHLVSSRSKQRA